MLAAIHSAAVLGVDAYDVTVEVDVAHGLPQFTIVGLATGSVRESRERVLAALVNSGFTVPPRRVTVNLAPGDVTKSGTALDLPIAVGVLVATGQLQATAADDLLLVGELGLDGALRAVRGTLPIARHAARRGCALAVPPDNVPEASLVRGLEIVAPSSLSELVAWLRHGERPAPARTARASAPSDGGDFSDVVGQESAKRALEIAAAGNHGIVLVGPPGAGKTMLARRLPGILPSLDEEDALEVIAIHSVAGLVSPGSAPIATRPFRAPHHSISAAGLVGGGNPPRPGEVSLAHHGVLFLDEMLELPRHVLDALRQPMEDGRVVLSRAASTISFPARFTLVGAMNPCPCGRAGDPARTCGCAPGDVLRYRARLSGPLADRIDMHIHVGAVALSDLGAGTGGERSAAIRERVERARVAQRERYREMPGVGCNAHVAGRWLLANGDVASAARAMLTSAAERFGLSARGYHRVLRVARTIADLDESSGVECAHVAEALRFRVVGRAGGASESWLSVSA